MKVTSAILTTMSGKLGGAVASTARGGIQYFRKLVQPSNPKTYLQDSVRAAMSSIAGAWKNTLSVGARAAWEALASGGESGIGVYTGANTVLLQGGGARQDTAPSSKALAWLALPLATQFTSASASEGVPTVALNVAGNTLGVNGEVINFYVQSRVQPKSRLAPVGNQAYAGSYTIAGTVHPSIAVPAFTHPQLVGAMINGAQLHVEVVKWKSTGEVSQRIGTLVTNVDTP